MYPTEHVQLPLDVDEANQSLEALRTAAAAQDRTVPARPQTTMSTFIHLVRLKRIESEIQHKIYRVDRAKSSSMINTITDSFLERLYAWKDVIPQESTQVDSTNPISLKDNVYRSYDSYVSRACMEFEASLLTHCAQQMASYHKTVRILLQPRLYEKVVDEKYFKICAAACRGICETYKSLHCKLPIAFTSLSLQSVFLSGQYRISHRGVGAYRLTTSVGLTLVYCIWHDSSNSTSFKSLNALTDCSIILYVMAERWPASRKYRDLFEAVKKSVIEAIEEGKHMPRKAVTSMKDDMQTPLQRLDADTTMESVTDDLQQMISDMVGETISIWPDTDVGMDDSTTFWEQPNDEGSKETIQVGWTPTDAASWYNSEFGPALRNGVGS